MKRATSLLSLIHRGLLCMTAAILVMNGANAQQREPVLAPEGQVERLEQLNREGRESKENQMAGEDVRGREEWFTFQRRYPYDMIPAGARVSAIREMQVMKQRLEQSLGTKQEGRGLLAANRWESVGPGNIGGRVRAIAIHPSDPQVVYIGAAAGGVWKTTNFGESWTTTFDTLSALAMGALAIDPTNPNIIYAGTGENTANIDAYMGNGIFRSTDGGVTWHNLPELRSAGAFSALHVHRTKPNILYAAIAKSGGGFYRSEDRGMTWTRVMTGDLYDITVNPNNNDEVYIAFRNSIRRSTDAGNSFTVVNNGISNINSSVRISIAVAPSQPTRLYALMARSGNNGNHIGEVFVTDDKGENWQLKNTFPTSFFNRQGWYDNCIGVDPRNPNVVLAGGIDVHRSSDGGSTWTNTTKGYSGGNVHVDQHIIAFDRTNPGLVFLGNDGGIYASLDGGINWQKISNGLAITQYYAMELDQTRPYRIYGGTQDNGTHGSFGTSGYTQTWNKVLDGDGFYVVVDLTDPNIIYAENYNGTPLYRIDANNTNSRTRIDRQISQSPEEGDVGYWSTPIAMSPADKRSLFTGRSALWRSTDRGSTWQSLPTGGSSKITAIGLSPTDARHMLVGTAVGDVRYSHDNGVTWQRSAGIPNRFITSIVYDPVTANRVYLTVSGFSSTTGRVFRSDDGGATFVDISANLPNIPANAIEIDPRNPSHLFLGTDIGVFASLNGGEVWMPFNEGLALSPVVSLKIHKSTSSLIAATHGRSMFRVNISSVDPVPVLLTPVGGETYTTPGTITVRWTNFNGPVKILISYDGGATWHLAAASVAASQDSLLVPVVKTTIARIRVEELTGGRHAESRDFTLTTPSNGSEQNKRGFVAEAIEARNGHLWATVRDSDSLYKLRLPSLTAREGLVRTGIPGRIRDLAYDAAADIFYALVTENDYSAPKVYRMDTTGAGLGQITLPGDLTHISGIAMVPEGLAVITPGATPEITVLNLTGGIVSRSGTLQGGGESDRRGLVWDGLGYVQGVVEHNPDLSFPSELQQLSSSDPLRIREATPIVLQTVRKLEFFGLAFDGTNYWATDTSGSFYRFERGKFFTSSVTVTNGIAGRVSSEVAIRGIVPNPAQGETTVDIAVKSSRQVVVELFDPTGLRVAELFEGRLEQGEHAIRFDGRLLPSGLYYVAVRGGDGQRDVRPVVIVK